MRVSIVGHNLFLIIFASSMQANVNHDFENVS